MTPDPTTVLRAAAAKARRVAEGVGAGHWRATVLGVMQPTTAAAASTYTAVMHPGVALAVAAWLEEEADFQALWESLPGANDPAVWSDDAALTLAREILAGDDPVVWLEGEA